MAVIADAHYYEPGLDGSITRYAKLYFRDVESYYSRLIGDLERAERDFKEGRIDKVVVLGDFLDRISTESLHYYEDYLLGKKELKKEEKEAFDRITRLLLRLRRMQDEGALVLIAGNHDDTRVYRIFGLKTLEKYECCGITFEHGHRFDIFSKFLDYVFWGFLRNKNSRKLRNLLRIFGYFGLKLMRKFEDSGFKLRYLRVIDGKLKKKVISGHFHVEYSGKNLKVLGDYVSYGAYIVEVNGKEDILISRYT